MMSRTGALFVLVFAATLLPFSARALVVADALPIHHIVDLEIVDGLAYVSIGAWGQTSQVPSVRILDLSDPAAPVEIGFFDIPYVTRDVEVVGGLAFITQPFGFVRIIDVSDPTLPVEIGAFSGQCHAADVEVVGNYAYLADQPTNSWIPECPYPFESKFRVFDISNPAAPTQVSETDISWPVDIEAVEGVVYAAGREGLELIDVSDPAAPVIVGLVPGGFLGSDIEVADGYVYTAGGGYVDPSTGEWYGLEVIDVSDPGNPFTVGSAVASGSSIEVVDGLAYLLGVGLQVVDVSNPVAPTRRGSLFITNAESTLGVYGGYAYLGTYGDGLNIVDLTLLDTPTEVGRAEVVDPAGDVEVPNDVAVLNGVAYLAVGEDDYYDPSVPPGDGGLRTYDITDPTAPTPLGGIDTADAALDVEIAAGLAFVAARTDGLRIFDVTNPSAPVDTGALALPGRTAKVEIVGTTAYVVDQGIRHHYYGAYRALRIVDVSNAADPVELGAIEFTDSRTACQIPGIAVVEPLVYVTCYGFYVVDVSNPTQPTLVTANRSFGDSRSSVEIAENRMYRGVHMGQYGDSLAVYDISNPTQPVYIDRASGASDRAIVVEDGFSYSAGWYGGLSVHDLVGPLPAVFLGGYPPDRGSWNGLAIADGLFFGVTRGGYLQVVDLGPEYKHTRSVEIAIRAEREPAVVNLASRGVVGVAILGAADFDVERIDRSTLRFGPSSATPTHKAGGHLEDVNGDAMPDLVSHYRIADTGISKADKNGCVFGQTSDGTPIWGCSTLGGMLPGGRANASGVSK
jgi:hypothetical protein